MTDNYKLSSTVYLCDASEHDLSAMQAVVSWSLCKVREQLVEWSRGTVRTAADWWEKGGQQKVWGPVVMIVTLVSSLFLFLPLFLS